MPNKSFAEKRLRQTEKRTLENRIAKSKVHTASKRTLAFIQANDIENAKLAFVDFTKAIDKAAGARAIHANKAARNKAKLQLKINALERAQR